jgi:prevent-host-death family protein
MGKMVGIAEFKANCTRLLREMQKDGEPITVTNRGKVVGVMSPPTEDAKPKSLFGCMKGTFTIHGDIVGPVDPDWEAKWDAKWDERGLPARAASSEA